MLCTFQPQVVAVAVLLLTATLLAVAASEQLTILLAGADIKSFGVSLDNLTDALRPDILGCFVVAALKAAATRLTVPTRSEALAVEFETLSFLTVATGSRGYCGRQQSHV